MINTRKKGFTLIELMTVVAIVAVLAALAIPSFLDSVRKARRSDAINSILDLKLAQEVYRTNNITYGELGDLGPDPLTSPDGHYDLTVPVHTATDYTIVATVASGDDQANDSCGNFTLTNTAGVIAKTTSKGVADQCWRR